MHKTLCRIGIIWTIGAVFAQLSFADAFHINQVGYNAQGPKFAVIETNGNQVTAFELVNSSTQAVAFSGTPSSGQQVTDWYSGRTYFRADFSSFETPGSYFIRATGASGQSTAFAIGPHPLFSNTFALGLSFFTGSRANDATVWNKDAAIGFYGNSGKGTRDVRGGWYDASGDISKYLSHLNYGNFTMPQQIPMSAYAMAEITERIPTALGTLGIQANMRSEALWGADYLLRVLDQEGYFYTNIFDNWTGFMGDRQICGFEGSDGIKTNEWNAGFREGAGVAIAALARISQWTTRGDSTSAAYLAGAQKAWQHLTASDFAKAKQYADNGILNFIDDITILLAASELYKATNNATYLTEARNRVSLMQGKLHLAGYFIADGGNRPFYHAADAGLPVIALARFMDIETDATQKNTARQIIQTHLNYLVDVTNESGVQNPFGYARQHIKTGGSVKSSFFIPHDNETGYWWQGESARLASLAAAALIGGRKIGGDTLTSLGVTPALHHYAMTQLGWIIGQNPLDISFMSGVGRNNPPSYGAGKPPYHGHLDGGISNGITGKNGRSDGSGIDWNPSFAPEEAWMNWRWVEQWIPHVHWYLFAVSATAELQEPQVPTQKIRQQKAQPQFAVITQSQQITVRLDRKAQHNTPWQMRDLAGQLLAKGYIATGEAEVQIPVSHRGVAILELSGYGSRPFVR